MLRITVFALALGACGPGEAADAGPDAADAGPPDAGPQYPDSGPIETIDLPELGSIASAAGEGSVRARSPHREYADQPLPRVADRFGQSAGLSRRARARVQSDRGFRRDVP